MKRTTTRHSMATKRKTKQRVTRQSFPRWFTSDRNQQVAEFLAHNFYLDRLVGREPSADIAPYNQFKRHVVERFLETLRDATKSATLTGTSVAA